MKDKLLITGGAGLLALNWAQASRNKFDVHLVLHNRKIQLVGTNTSSFQLDTIYEIQNNFKKIKPDLVIHMAGLTNVEECESNPELARHINVDLAENVAKVCAELKIQLVHISTDHLFLGNEQMINEEHITSPQNVYAKTKAEAELRVLNSNPDSLVIRTNFYGVGASYRTSFSDMIIDVLKNNNSLSLFQDVFYTPIYTGVLVQAVHELIKAKAAGIYHVVGDERLSKYEFGLKVARKFKLNETLIIKGTFKDQPELIGRPSDMSLSNKKTYIFLGSKLGNVNEHVDLLYQQYKSGLAAEIQNL